MSLRHGRLLALLLSAACSRGHDAAPARDTTPATPIVAATDTVHRDPWLTSADSVLARFLANERYGAPHDSITGIGSCDDGGDNATLLVAMNSYRVLGHSAPQSVPTSDGGDGGPARQVTYTLELRSAARFVPTWTLNDSSLSVTPVPNTEPYVAEVSAHVDTVSFTIEQSRGGSGWSQCDLYHEPDTRTTYWNFVQQREPWITVVQWRPASASWQAIAQLSDSLASLH